MSHDEKGPCGDCVVCQTRMISALVSDEMRAFLSACVEAALQTAAREVAEGNLNLIPHLTPLISALAILDPDRVEYVMARLDDLGITILALDEED